jgi:hypothetical protein
MTILKASMKFIFLISAMTLFISCNKQKPEGKSEDGRIEMETCYRYINNKDTVQLNARIQDSTVTGTLVYKLSEKDKNEGTIQGYMDGDLIIADYVFTSEGTSSIRQVVFKKANNGLIEGYGDIVTENKRTKFKNKDSLDFNNSIFLQKSDCDE